MAGNITMDVVEGNITTVIDASTIIAQHDGIGK